MYTVFEISVSQFSVHYFVVFLYTIKYVQNPKIINQLDFLLEYLICLHFLDLIFKCIISSNNALGPVLISLLKIRSKNPITIHNKDKKSSRLSKNKRCTVFWDTM